MSARAKLTATPADVLKWQSDLVRTRQYIYLGKMQKISIGPSASFRPPERGRDPIIDTYGRMMELRRKPIPIAQSVDRSQILICGYFLSDDDHVGLPDVPDPTWVAPEPSDEEIYGRVEMVDGHEVRRPVPTSQARRTPRMLPQRLEDRTSELLEGTNFYVFSPVLHATYQPVDVNGQDMGTIWTLDFSFDPATHSYTSLLVDRQTGEGHFFGGFYDIRRPTGEE